MSKENISPELETKTLTDIRTLSNEIKELKRQFQILEDRENYWDQIFKDHYSFIFKTIECIFDDGLAQKTKKENQKLLNELNELKENYHKKSENKEIDTAKEEEKAIDFINQNILTKLPKQGEFQAEGLWDGLAKILIDQIKQQAIVWAGKALEHLKEQIFEQGIEQAINLTDYVLEKLQDYLFEKYQNTTDEKKKEIFKNKILEKFPNSGLANKLKN